MSDYYPRPHEWPCQCDVCLEWARVEIETELAQPWAQEALRVGLGRIVDSLPERIAKTLKEREDE